MHTPLPPAIEESLISIGTGCINILKLEDSRYRSNFLSSKAKDSLLKQKKSLIVIDNDYDSEEVFQSLSTQKLAHFACLWDNENYLSKKLLERFRILTTLSHVRSNQHTHDHIDRYRRRFHEGIMKDIQGFSRKNGSGLSIKENILNKGHKSNQVLTPQQYQFFKQIHLTDNFCLALTELEKAYQSRFRNISLGLLDNSVYQSSSSITNTKNRIDSILNQIRLSKEEINEIKDNLLQDLDKELLQELKNISFALSELKEIYFTYDLEEHVRMNEHISKALQKIKQNRLIINPIDIGEQNLLEELPQSINSLESILENQSEIIEKFRNKEFKRYTPFNIEKKQWQRLNKILLEIEKEIGECDLINLRINTKPLSLISLENDLNLTNDKLLQIQSLLSDKEYTAYRLLQSELNINDSIIDFFIDQHQGDWTTIASKYTQEVVVQKYINLNQAGFNSNYHRLSELIHKQSDAASDCIHNYWIDIRRDAFENFKVHQKEMATILLSGHETDLKLSDIYDIAPNYISTYFPLMIVKSEDLNQFSGSLEHWDHIIFYNQKETSSTFINPLMQNGIEVSIVGSYDLNIDNIQTKFETRCFFSEHIKLKYGQPFQLLESSERLNQAKSLSVALADICHRFSVYQLKNKSIISFCSEVFNSKLIELLPAKELNILYDKSNLAEDLLDALIPIDNKVMILYENGLINDNKLESIPWQIHVIKLLEESGIDLIDVNTIEMAKQYNTTINKILSRIDASTIYSINSAVVMDHKKDDRFIPAYT